jgi:hypothetical protein
VFLAGKKEKKPMIKEALEYLQTLAKRPEKINAFDKVHMVVPNDMEISLIKPETPHTLTIGSLTGLVEYLKNAAGMDELWDEEDKYLIHIVDYNYVTILSGLEPRYMVRRNYISARVNENKFPLEQYLPASSFIVSLMTNFEKTEGRDTLLQFVSSMRARHMREELDEGVTQSVTVQKSIATLAEVTVPNPVQLTPHVTFAEVANPSQYYVFRIRQIKPDDPITCALFPIASEAWKVLTINEIREYFKSIIADNQLEIEATVIS